MKVVVAAALSILVFAPSLTRAQTATPHKSRTVQVTTRPPDPAKWQSLTAANGTRRVFKCKPLACFTAETVSFTFQKGSLAEPTKQALEKFANIDRPESIRAAAAANAVVPGHEEKVDTLFSAAVTLKNYPAVLNETKISRAEKYAFVETAIIFAGPVVIRIESNSSNRDLAKKSLDQFIEVMQIVEKSGPPPGKPQGNNTQSL